MSIVNLEIFVTFCIFIYRGMYDLPLYPGFHTMLIISRYKIDKPTKMPFAIPHPFVLSCRKGLIAFAA
jgi:hypothetical protein